MPGQARSRRAATNQFLGKHRMKVVHGVGLRCGGILPAKAELAHAALHGADHVADLLLQAVGTEVAVEHGALGIGGAAFQRFTAARDHEARRRILARARERERIERRLGPPIDTPADTSSRHPTSPAVAYLPTAP